MAEASRDQNSVTTLLGASSVDGVTPVRVYADPVTHRLLVDLAGGGIGTVTSVSVATANGFAGDVTNPTTTPEISIETTVIGLLKGDGTGVSAATEGTDYQGPITLTTSGTSGAATFIANTLNIPQYSGGGQVDSVSGTTNRITVNSADPENPIVDIASNYVGQSSITTLGTITTGVWTGTDIALADGGTGASLTDPNFNAAWVWDDTTNATRLAALSGLTYDTATNTLTASGGGGTPGGSTTQLQYNNAGAFGGISGATTNGTAVTFASGGIVAQNITNGAATLTLPVVTGTIALTSDIPAAGANQALSNLASVAINTTLVSDTNNTDDLGTTGTRWRTAYLATSLLVGGTNTITATTSNFSGGTATFGDTISVGQDIVHAGDTDTYISFDPAEDIIDFIVGGSAALELTEGVFDSAVFGSGWDVRVTSPGTNAASVPTLGSTSTLTNKRMQPRTASSTTNANLTPDLTAANVYFRTTQTATLAINAPTGTPIIGEVIVMYISAAGAQTINWNATYIPYGAALPVLTVAGKTLMVTAQYNGTNWQTLTAVMI